MPTKEIQSAASAAISVHVSFDLPSPVFLIARGHFGAGTTMRMPEAPVYKDRYFQTEEDNVGSAGQSFEVGRKA